MLDGTHYFECRCGSDEHTLRFTLDKKEKEIHTSIFLNDYYPWWKRVWVGFRYACGYKCRYGHWDCWILRQEDADRLRTMLDELCEPETTKESDRTDPESLDDGYGNLWSPFCLECGGKTMQIVRPGKVQCSECD